jgi:hypothetical protein
MFTGNEEHEITFTDAASLTAEYRSKNPYRKRGGYFSRTAIETLLAQDGCVGIRIYFGCSSGNPQELIVVGVDENEDDLVGHNYVCMDNGICCPPHCGTDNMLNSD